MKTTEQLKDEKLEALIAIVKEVESNVYMIPSLRTRATLALAMLTEVEARYFKKTGYEIHRINGDGDVEFCGGGEWKESGLHDHQIKEENGWTEYFPDAKEAVKDASKPYLPLPAPDLVVLGLGDSFKVPHGGRFEGWAFDLDLPHPTWNHSTLWLGNMKNVVFAVPRDSEIARLNWEAILNRELEGLGLAACPEIGSSWRMEYFDGGERPKGVWFFWDNYRWCASNEDGPLKKGHYLRVVPLEAVKDEQEESEQLAEAKRVFSEGVNALTDEQVDRICEAVADPVPTERQKMAAGFIEAYLTGKDAIDVPQDVEDCAFQLADYILGRKDGE
jgi:hypothetical protein